MSQVCGRAVLPLAAAGVACLGVLMCSDLEGPHLRPVPLRKHQPVPGSWAACLPALTGWTPNSRDARGRGGLHGQGLEGAQPPPAPGRGGGGTGTGLPGGAAVPPSWRAASRHPPVRVLGVQAGRPASVTQARGHSSGAVWRKRARRPEEVSAYTCVFFLIPIVQPSEVGSARSACAQPPRSWQGRAAVRRGPSGLCVAPREWDGVTLGLSVPTPGPVPRQPCRGPGEWTPA